LKNIRSPQKGDVPGSEQLTGTTIHIKAGNLVANICSAQKDKWRSRIRSAEKAYFTDKPLANGVPE
jgi:hypothetical protein